MQKPVTSGKRGLRSTKFDMYKTQMDCISRNEKRGVEVYQIRYVQYADRYKFDTQRLVKFRICQHVRR